jgi:hypothetical protein
MKDVEEMNTEDLAFFDINNKTLEGEEDGRW